MVGLLASFTRRGPSVYHSLMRSAPWHTCLLSSADYLVPPSEPLLRAALAPRRSSAQLHTRAAGGGGMALHWNSFLRAAERLSKRPVVVAFGATAVGTSVWAVQSEGSRRHRRPVGGVRCASSSAGTVAEGAPAAQEADPWWSGCARPDAAPSEGAAPPGSPDSPASAAASPQLDATPTESGSGAAAKHIPPPDAEPPFTLAAAAALIPHPAKVAKGGEDAFFVCERGLCMGVADGVGGWAEIGVDPGLYSRELMAHAKHAAAALEDIGELDPQKLMAVAHTATQARGSSTACILCLRGRDLLASNLGDSGFMVVRGGELLFMSPQQQHEFNFPFQIGSRDSMSDMPSAAQRFTVPLKAGDVLVVGTDGVFDNVYPDEAAALVAVSKARGEPPHMSAAGLAQYARKRAADPTHLSPFAFGAQQLGFRYFGGKMDDITVVIAYVEERAGAAAATPGSAARETPAGAAVAPAAAAPAAAAGAPKARHPRKKKAGGTRPPAAGPASKL